MEPEKVKVNGEILFGYFNTAKGNNDNVDDDSDMMILMLLMMTKMLQMRMMMITSGGKRPGGLATTTTPVMPKAATAILQTPQWSLPSVGYNLGLLEGNPSMELT